MVIVPNWLKQMTDRKFTLLVIIVAVVASIAFGFLFWTNPWIDLVLERALYEPKNGFVFNSISEISVLRKFVMSAYGIWYGIVGLFIGGFIIKKISVLPSGKGWNFHQWLYLGLTSLIGPLLVSNIILKNNWGRARPMQVEEFGGKMDYSLPLQLSDQCQTNCSFVAGEPSSMFMIFISLAFIVSSRRYWFAGLALVLGSLSGLMRMGQGGHFFSDVVFAGLFMALVAAIIYWIMFIRTNSKTVRR